MIVSIVEFLLDDENEVVRKRTHKFASALELDEGWKELKTHKHSHFYTVNCSKASAPPAGFQAELGHWCPYCESERIFEYETRTELEHCNVCGISENDFYVKKYNRHYYIKQFSTKGKQNDHNRRGNGQHGEDDPDSSID